MTSNYIVTADEIARLLGVSKNYAYAIIRRLNHELKEKGYIVVSGKLPRAYWEEKFYGVKGGDYSWGK